MTFGYEGALFVGASKRLNKTNHSTFNYSSSNRFLLITINIPQITEARDMVFWPSEVLGTFYPWGATGAVA